ncbi:MAG: DUF1330 domain-containing protein [Sphingobium sp.]|nr:DUF1330 domain-containing protein [Sphingomonas sp.]
MPLYVLALIKIVDRDEYDRYSQGFIDLFQRSQGVKILAADESPVALEGEWDGRKAVILEFADKAAYEAFMLFDEYQRISVQRRAGTEGVMLLVQGLGLN